MDTSKEYIKMCQRSQLPWHPSVGDWAYSERDGVSCLDAIILALAEATPFGKNGARIKADHVPLFLQDQLQEMVRNGRSANGLLCMAENFRKTSVDCIIAWCKDDIGEYFTMEKFWLMLVMYWLRQKRWDGNDWKRR